MHAKPQLLASPKQLHKNMRLYIITRIFQKRVFLPLIGIYFTTHGGITLKNLGLLFSWFALVQILAELPTGYIADKYGKVLSLRLGASLNIIASTLYVVAANPVGIFFAYTLEATGYSFFGGASEAILHDTLEAQERDDQYTKVHSRIQAAALAINAVLMALVPLTYKYNPKLPFMISAVLYSVLLVVNLNIREVYKPGISDNGLSRRQRIKAIIRFRTLLPFLLALGFISAVYTAPSDYINIQLKNLGFQPHLLGLLFSAASALGVFVGLFIHLLKKLSLARYVLLDVMLAVAVPISVWLNHTWVIIPLFIINMAFWRYRRIIYQAHMFEIFPVREKAMLISAVNNSTDVFEFGIPLLFGVLAATHSIPVAFGVLALAAITVSIPLLHQTRLLRQKAATILAR